MMLQTKYRKQLFVGAIIFSFFTLSAINNLVYFITRTLAEGEPVEWKALLIDETTGAYSVLILLPFLLWFFRRFPIHRKNLFGLLILHILASLLYGASHTTLMMVSRELLYWIFDMGTYNYGRLLYRYPMEYTHQHFEYWLYYGVYQLIRFVQERQKQKLKTAQLEQQLTSARLQALQMKLHPHFLFNTLNLISATMYDDVKVADTMMANLSDLLRCTLNSTDSSEHTLGKELDILRYYLDIMEARFQEKLVVTLDISDETREAMIPSFILQPLVENSIKYCMEKGTGIASANIHIVSRKIDHQVVLYIRDNGPGINVHWQHLKNKGIGLSNVAERLDNLYGPDHRFTMRNIETGGLETVIGIPFRQSGSEESPDG